MASGRRTHWTILGRVDYARAARLQLAVREALRRGDGPERLLLLEHPPVYTMGRNASAEDLLWTDLERKRQGIEVHATDRGGQVTYHGPGQLVGYPIVDLHPDRRDIRRYVRDLQESLVRTLAELGLEAQGGAGDQIGVWVEGRKIASIGVHLSRWLTTHGFALNLDPTLAHFAGIVPCGLQDVSMTSVARELGGAPPLEEVALRYVRHFGSVFEREPVEDRAFLVPEARAPEVEAVP